MAKNQSFDELRSAATAYGFDRLAAHLDDPRVRAQLGWKGPQRRQNTLVVLMSVLTFLLSAVYLGGTAVIALKMGATTATQPTVTAPGSSSSIADCSASNVFCVTSDQTSRVNWTRTDVIYECQGHTIAGMTITAHNVTVKNCKFANCASTCLWVHGPNNVIQDNDISQVYWSPSTGDDIDGMRFFGDGNQMINNKFHDILVGNDEHGAHLDCMQTYATSSAGGGSSNIVVRGNDCRSPHFHQCLMAEGPNSTDGGGGGGGISQNWTIDHNYYECHANQTVKLDDIHNVTITNNNFAGTGGKAIAIGSLSTGITADSTNTLGSGYGSLIGS